MRLTRIIYEAGIYAKLVIDFSSGNSCLEHINPSDNVNNVPRDNLSERWHPFSIFLVLDWHFINGLRNYYFRVRDCMGSSVWILN